MRGIRGLYLSDDRSYETVGVRGFSRPGDYGNRVLVLIDGHPTNDNWVNSSYIGYDGRTDLEDVERIDRFYRRWGAWAIVIARLVRTQREQIAALKTNQVAGVTTDSVTVYKFMEEGGGRILVKFAERVKDFHVHIIYASDKLMKENPKALRDFLAAWFETIAFMKANKDKTVEITSKVINVSPSVGARAYDEQIAIFSTDGTFDPKAVEVLKESFIEMGLLKEKPDDKVMFTTQFVPVR